MTTNHPYQNLIIIYADSDFQWFQPISKGENNGLVSDFFTRVFEKNTLSALISRKEILKENFLFPDSDGIARQWIAEFNSVLNAEQELKGWIIMIYPRNSIQNLLKQTDKIIEQIQQSAEVIPEEQIEHLIQKLRRLSASAESSLTPISKLWIIDDDSVITYITKRLVHSVEPSIEITEFMSAKLALEKLKLDQAPPDIILLDINMPGISGWTFLDELGTIEHPVEVYMYSTSIDPQDLKKAKEYKMLREFLSKPLDNRTLQRILYKTSGKRMVS